MSKGPTEKTYWRAFLRKYQVRGDTKHLTAATRETEAAIDFIMDNDIENQLLAAREFASPQQNFNSGIQLDPYRLFINEEMIYTTERVTNYANILRPHQYNGARLLPSALLVKYAKKKVNSNVLFFSSLVKLNSVIDSKIIKNADNDVELGYTANSLTAIVNGVTHSVTYSLPINKWVFLVYLINADAGEIQFKVLSVDSTNASKGRFIEEFSGIAITTESLLLEEEEFLLYANDYSITNVRVLRSGEVMEELDKYLNRFIAPEGHDLLIADNGKQLESLEFYKKF